VGLPCADLSHNVIQVSRRALKLLIRLMILRYRHGPF
jgi:hypothetical protein